MSNWSADDVQHFAGVTRTVRVRPGWRLCHQGRAVESGEEITLPILQACEWSAWGSVERISGDKVAGKPIRGWAT
jgi:hypothetical protein